MDNNQFKYVTNMHQTTELKSHNW